MRPLRKYVEYEPDPIEDSGEQMEKDTIGPTLVVIVCGSLVAAVAIVCGLFYWIG